MLRPREERLPLTGDQRINNKPEFIHQPSIDKARRSSSTPNEINVFAGLLLEASDFVESPDEARVRPESRIQGAREHIMRGARGEAGPFDLSRRALFGRKSEYQLLDGAIENGADGLERVDGARFDSGSFRLLTNFTAAKEIDAASVGDRRNSLRRRISKRSRRKPPNTFSARGCARLCRCR